MGGTVSIKNVRIVNGGFWPAVYSQSPQEQADFMHRMEPSYLSDKEISSEPAASPTLGADIALGGAIFIINVHLVLENVSLGWKAQGREEGKKKKRKEFVMCDQHGCFVLDIYARACASFPPGAHSRLCRLCWWCSIPPGWNSSGQFKHHVFDFCE